MTKLTELLEICNKATPGPRKIGYLDGSGIYNEENGTFCLVDIADNCIFHAKMCDWKSDANFVAAFSPHTAKALILSLTKAMEILAHVEGCFNCAGCRDHAKDTLKQIHEELEGL